MISVANEFYCLVVDHGQPLGSVELFVLDDHPEGTGFLFYEEIVLRVIQFFVHFI